jgi:serine/threonine protein kinase
MVYKAIQKETGQHVAVKMMSVEEVQDIDREIALLVKLLSPFIISFIEAIKCDDQIWVWT